MRWVVAVTALVVAVVIAVREEKRIHLALVRASRRSWRRALLLIVGYHVALVVAALVAIAIVTTVRQTVSDPLAIVLTGVFFALLAPFTTPFMPAQVYAGSQDATTARELRRAGATPGVSRVLGIGGAMLWFVTVVPLALVAIVGVFVDLGAS